MINVKTYQLNVAILPAIAILAVSLMLLTRPILPSRSVQQVFIDDTIIVNKTVTTAQLNKTAVSRADVRLAPAPDEVAMVPPIVPPKVIHRVLPTYPIEALEKGLEGSVVLSVYIDVDGMPGQIDKKLSSGSDSMDGSAIQAVSQWKFSPAKRGAQAINCCLEIPISFKIK